MNDRLIIEIALGAALILGTSGFWILAILSEVKKLDRRLWSIEKRFIVKG